MNINELLEKRKILIDKKLDEILPKENTPPRRLHKAMRYSVFSGGKRIRPILAIESCLCCGGRISNVIDAACAIELAHTFSLIHDDLPAMDDDDTRRGKPTCHKRFDEATAILAGDSLLALAFKVLAKGENPLVEVNLTREFSTSIGSLGIAGGQCVDIGYEGKKKNLSILNYINSHKTGMLIKSALKIGAQAAKANLKKIKAMERFGAYIGEAFQIVDDILDNGDSVAVLGRALAIKRARHLTEMAKVCLKDFKGSVDTLKEIADYLIKRKF